MAGFLSRIKDLIFPSTGSRLSHKVDESSDVPAKVPGRNVLCYCGNGHKYKKFHLSLDRKPLASAYRQAVHMKRQEKIGAFVPTNEIGIERRGFAMLNSSLRKKKNKTPDVGDVD